MTGKMNWRFLLGLTAVLAIGLAAFWWLATGLFANDYESTCEGKAAAKVAFAFSNVGFLLSISALILAIVETRQRVGWIMLGIYSALLGLSLVLLSTCA